ncbi:EamA/RhaT family transporter [Streptomyces actinomycinicus]|uniref:EamA/RhaT family transporter n=1 Tax=Streptomyces actinomycinicus TaxID=1695166 RepID=A0A937ELQ2_9ACTN|nr:EamA/RhaT family transporter [Streptomyces actinomycinicus]MBL1085578.1 EamA/RhaT family transporter [Streptomyces actinomycinicus]
MSDETGTPDSAAGSEDSAAGATQAATAQAVTSQAATARDRGPRPEPLRFFGTSWVNHDNGYPARRAGVAVGSLAAAVLSCLVLRFAYEGIQIADTGSFVTVLVIAMFAICSALAFRNTWEGFGKRHDPERQASLRGLLAIGFVGSLLAYFVRSLTEAPGEKLHREEYEKAREAHERRTTRRTGNPAKNAKSPKNKRRR